MGLVFPLDNFWCLFFCSGIYYDRFGDGLFFIAKNFLHSNKALRICVEGKKCDELPTYPIIMWRVFYWLIQFLAW